MKLKGLFFAAAILFTFSFAAFSQNAVTNYSGQWEADLTKSELPEMIKGIEGISMSVKQDEKTISVETHIKGGRGGFGGGTGSGRENGSGMGGGQMQRREPQATVYSLDGKETSSEVGGGGPFAGTSTLKAILSSEELKLSSVRKGNSPMGEFTITTNETWTLSTDGKTLTVNQERETPRGNMSAKIIFVKKEAGEPKVVDVPASGTAASDATPTPRTVPKRINGGVINGKATYLARPNYTDDARIGGVSGEVKVQVLLDFEGKVVSASAISGPQLLQQSAVDAARRSKFPRTTLGGNPVEVVGILVYMFMVTPR